MHEELNTAPVRGASFWVRAAAHLLVDLPILLVLTVPPMMILMIRVFGIEAILTPGAAEIPWWWNLIFNAVIVLFLVGLWKFTQATPGKQAFRLRIVRLADGGVPTLRQWTVRALAYLVSSLPVLPVPIEMMGKKDVLWVPLCFGFVWILIDPRRRGWHDMLSGTVTVAIPRA